MLNKISTFENYNSILQGLGLIQAAATEYSPKKYEKAPVGAHKSSGPKPFQKDLRFKETDK